MNKNIYLILKILLGVLSLPFISTFLQIAFGLGSKESLLNFYISIGLGFGLLLIFRKRMAYSVSLLIIWLYLVFLTAKRYSNYRMMTAVEVSWDRKEHNVSIPFYIIPGGHIFLQVSINGVSGYMGFDTGAEISGVRQGIEATETKLSTVVTDANGLSKKMSISILDNLSFGEIQISQMASIPIPLAAWDKCGIFPEGDSIVGVLGSNAINHFVWDFDIVDRTVTLSGGLMMKPDNQNGAIDLIKTGMNSWCVEVEVGGEAKSLRLDTGSNQFITINDSLNSSEVIPEVASTHFESRSLFSYEDCLGDLITVDIPAKKQRKVVADIKIQSLDFADIAINDMQAHSLLGNPLLFKFRRVIMDFSNQKMYLIDRI